MLKLKSGTRIEVHGWTLDGQDVWYPAKIGRQLKQHGTPPTGFHPVTYDDGGKMLVHENRFRVVDNLTEGNAA